MLKVTSATRKCIPVTIGRYNGGVDTRPRKPRLHFWVKDQSVLDDLMQRAASRQLGDNAVWARGNRHARAAVIDYVLADEELRTKTGVKTKADLKWSRTAGCGCGCSPGFIIQTGWIGWTGEDIYLSDVVLEQVE